LGAAVSAAARAVLSDGSPQQAQAQADWASALDDLPEAVHS
jgi:hypothetical protein